MAIQAKMIVPPETQRLLDKVEKRYGTQVLSDILFRFMRPQANRTAGAIAKFARGILNTRTGNLTRSIVGRAIERRGLPAIQVGIFRGPALSYAGVQEYGTKPFNPQSPFDTIRPTRSRSLAIPVGDDVLTGAGVSRFTSPLKQPEELQFIPFRKKSLHGIVVGGLFRQTELIAATNAEEGTVDLNTAKASWLLMSRLDLEPREYLKKGMDKEIIRIVTELADFLERYLTGA